MVVTHCPTAASMEKSAAMGIGGIAMGFAPNIGPLIGGALANTAGWRSFYIILVGLLAVLWAANALLVWATKPAR